MNTEYQELLEELPELDEEERVSILQLAKNGSLAEAEYRLAGTIADNWGITSKYFDTWMLRAAQNGFPQAMVDYGIFCAPQRMKINWYMKAAAAGSGEGARYALYHYHDTHKPHLVLRHLRRFLKLGISLESFTDFADKRRRAEDGQERQLGWTVSTELAKAGHAQSCAELGYAFYWGEWEGHPVEKNHAMAAAWWKRAARLRHAWASLELGLMYEYGEGMRRNRRKAFLCYEQSAELGYARGITNLGYAYFWGIGCKKDPKRSVELFEAAIRAGDNTIAPYNLAERYCKGDTVPRDYDKAWHYLRISACRQYPDALTRMAIMTMQGHGTPKDLRKGIRLLRKAVKLGGSWAKLQLGLCYEHGRGVPRNIPKAHSLVADVYREIQQGKCSHSRLSATREYNRLCRKLAAENPRTQHPQLDHSSI